MIYLIMVLYLMFLVGVWIWFDNQRSRSLVDSINRNGNYNISETVYNYIKFLYLWYKKKIFDFFENIYLHLCYRKELCYEWSLIVLSKKTKYPLINKLCQKVLDKIL